ncbi:glucose 1-dehydrogenase [Variovorax sp. J22P271]|uniref:SDR family NAD(P)-dependent oxidoreductase n=1 Tax=Variovorax davisae TaxID=3053515 RepID=UPI0025788C0D|nr:glucose 1-dehydrogenase [Variovorax sp. J22P271]MDM0032009.1 glucose 1-dehydrogenase [Variovorax sp. J22P271]
MSEFKVALVTGAGSGVGLETVALLHGNGYATVVLDIDSAAAQAQARRLDPQGHSAMAVACDVCDDAQVREITADMLRRWGRIDVLINNAGLPQANLPFDQVDDAQWQRVWGVNVMGIVNLARAVVPAMRESKAGAIVNVTSVAGVRARGGLSAYCAAKAAAISLTQTLALELAPQGIRVNAVAPGSLATPMFDKFLQPGESWDAAMQRYVPQIPVGRLGTPAEIAQAVVWAATQAPDFMTGQTLMVDGGRSL